MMIFPRLARDVERQRTYLDSQLISFQTSSFFAKAETIPRLARFILPPFPPQIFFKNIGSHRIHHFCDDCLERLCSRSPLRQSRFLTITFFNWQLFTSYPELSQVRAIISPFMILSQGSCIYVHASQFNSSGRMLDRGRISEMCAIFFASCFTFALLFTVSRRDYERCYLNPFHSP